MEATGCYDKSTGIWSVLIWKISEIPNLENKVAEIALKSELVIAHTARFYQKKQKKNIYLS